MNLLFTLLFFPLFSFARDFVPTTFSTKYEESSISLIKKNQVKVATGTIDYKFPGNLRLESLSPTKSTVVVNREKSWYYQPPFETGNNKKTEPGQVTIQRSTNWPLLKIFDSLKNGVENNKLFTYQYRGKELILTFDQAIQKEIGVKEFHLVSDKDPKAVKSIEDFEKFYLVKMSGPNVNYKFIDFKANVSFSVNHFIFDVPKNTKVSTK